MGAISQGNILGYYKILERMEPYPRLQVYKARDLEQQRVVCLLTPADAAGKRQESVERLKALVSALQWLDHPGLAQVYDYLQADNRFFLVMEFVPGGNLETILEQMNQQAAWPRFDEALGLFHQVLASVRILNERGAPGRSIDPRWIHFRPEPSLGMPFCSVLTDPGAGLLLAPVKGKKHTPAETQGLDAARQIADLGVLLYRLVTGNHLPEGLPVTSEHLLDVRPDLPRNVVGVLTRLLSTDSRQRYQQASEVAGELMEVGTQVTQSTASSASGRPESLMSYYLNSLVKERSGNSVTPVETSELDRIQIIGPGIGKQTVLASRDGMTVGRVTGNDIVLNDLLVSRLHARIQFDDDAYQVIDLNSTNGTFLGEQKLLPGVAEIWRPGTPLRVGDTVLRLLPAKPVKE